MNGTRPLETLIVLGARRMLGRNKSSSKGNLPRISRTIRMKGHPRVNKIMRRQPDLHRITVQHQLHHVDLRDNMHRTRVVQTNGLHRDRLTPVALFRLTAMLPVSYTVDADSPWTLVRWI